MKRISQAIETKFVGPTDTKGARVKATCAAGSIILNWDDNMDTPQNHIWAAKCLLEKLQWDRFFEIETGSIKNTYVHVLVERK